MDQDTQQNQDAQKSPSERISIIEAVKTPLGFFVLVVLVVEAILLGIVAGLSEGIDRTITIIGMLLLIGGLVGIVAFLAYNRPEALFGERDKKRLKQEPGSDYHLTGQWRLYYYLGKNKISERAVGSAKITKAKENDFRMTIHLKKSKSGKASRKVFEYEGKIVESQILTTFKSAGARGGLKMVGTMVMLPNSEGDQVFCGATYVRNNIIVMDKAILKRK